MIDKYKNLILGILSGVLIVLLLSCKSLSVPDIKTFFYNVDKLKTAYCAESMADVRAGILAKIHEKHPEYPEHGFCGIALDLPKAG
jgi:hypothetical protein